MAKRGLREEDRMHLQFGALLKKYEGYGKLKSKRFSYDASGENRSIETGALLKKKGLNPGSSDYSFRVNKGNICHNIFIEFKTPTGKQSPNQKLFEATCDADNERYYIARSVKEGLDILINENILIDS